MFQLLFITRTFLHILDNYFWLNCLLHISRTTLTVSADHICTCTHRGNRTDTNSSESSLTWGRNSYLHLPQGFFSWVIYCVLAAVGWWQWQRRARLCFTVVQLQVSFPLPRLLGETARKSHRQSGEWSEIHTAWTMSVWVCFPLATEELLWNALCACASSKPCRRWHGNRLSIWMSFK